MRDAITWWITDWVHAIVWCYTRPLVWPWNAIQWLVAEIRQGPKRRKEIQERLRRWRNTTAHAGKRALVRPWEILQQLAIEITERPEGKARDRYPPLSLLENFILWLVVIFMGLLILPVVVGLGPDRPDYYIGR